MDSGRLNKKGFYKFTWTVKNFLLYGRRYDGDLFSPEFRVRVGESFTVWRLHDNILHTVLERSDDTGPDKISIFIEISCVKTDGKVESLYFSGKKDVEKMFTLEVISSRKWVEILSDSERSQYCQKDSFTFQVLMWTSPSHIYQNIEESFVTQIEVEKIVCQKRIENFCKLPFDLPILCSPPLRDDFKILLKRSKSRNSISVDFCHQACRLYQIYLIMYPRYNFKLSVLDSQGIPLDIVYERCESMRADKSYKFPDFITMDDPKFKTVQPDDALDLQFEFTFETGNVKVFKSMIAIKNLQSHSNIHVTEAPKPGVSSLSLDLRAIYSKKTFTDIQLKAGEEIFSAHKVILSGRSPIFAAMFLGEFAEKKSPVVHIDDLDATTLDKLLLYMYTDIVDELEEETALKLLYAADKYQVLPLKEKCTSYLKNIISLKNVCLILEFADLHQEELLKKTALEFIYSHHRSILSSKEWRQFISKHVVLGSEIICQLSTRYSLVSGVGTDLS